MGYLIEPAATIGSAGEAASALSAAFIHIGALLLASPQPNQGEATFDHVASYLGSRMVKITGFDHELVTVPGRDWDRGEVETNLRQVEVLVHALRTEFLSPSVAIRVNPTQQPGYDAAGELSGRPWVLEAFGGARITNNDKLAYDLQSLCGCGEQTKLLAFRKRAWTLQGTLTDKWNSFATTARKTRSQAGFKAIASVRQVAYLNDIVLAEARDITITPSKRDSDTSAVEG